MPMLHKANPTDRDLVCSLYSVCGALTIRTLLRANSYTLKLIQRKVHLRNMKLRTLVKHKQFKKIINYENHFLKCKSSFTRYIQFKIGIMSVFVCGAVLP